MLTFAVGRLRLSQPARKTDGKDSGTSAGTDPSDDGTA
jgi:hypothetical protein